MLMNDNKILRHGYVDWYVLIGVISLMFSSLAFVYSASSNFAMNKSGSSEAILESCYKSWIGNNSNVSIFKN